MTILVVLVIVDPNLFVILFENFLVNLKEGQMINFEFFKKKKKRRMPVSREKHQWQLVSRSYASPIRSFGEIDLSKMTQNLAEKLLLGVTTYLWECLLTGDVRKEEILGSDTQVLEELLIKVKQYGKQLIKDESGQAFSIDILQPVVDPTTLPMRKI